MSDSLVKTMELSSDTVMPATPRTSLRVSLQTLSLFIVLGAILTFLPFAVVFGITARGTWSTCNAVVPPMIIDQTDPCYHAEAMVHTMPEVSNQLQNHDTVIANIQSSCSSANVTTAECQHVLALMEKIYTPGAIQAWCNQGYSYGAGRRQLLTSAQLQQGLGCLGSLAGTAAGCATIEDGVSLFFCGGGIASSVSTCT